MSDSTAFRPRAETWRLWIVASAEKLFQSVCSESVLGYRRSGFTLLVVAVLLGTILIVLGAPPVAGPWDMMVLLDGGWRVVNGQVPHTDFHNPIGPLSYLLVAFGMKVAAPSTASITYGNVLLLALLLPLAWYIASARLPWAVAFVFVLFLSIFLVSPRPPGYGIRETTYAMIYNRQGYVLISLLLLYVFLKPQNSAKQSPSIEGSFVGVLLALLLYCKITYFLVGAALTLFAVVLGGRPRRWFLALAGAFGGVCVAFASMLHINLHSYLSDIVAAGHSQSRAMRFKFLLQSLTSNGTWIYMLVFCLCIWTWAENRDGRSWFSTLRAWLIAGSIVAGALLISSGNASQGGGMDDPLYFIAAVIFLEVFRRQNAEQLAQRGTAVRFAHASSLVLVVPVFCGTILVPDLASCAYAWAWNVEKRPVYSPSRRIHSTNLRDFYVPESTQHITAYWPARDHPARINDGIDLLQRYLQRGDRVTTVAFGNPFSFALGLMPARDGPLWWDLNFSFDRLHHPAAEDFLGDASLVMVPRLADRSNGCCFATADVVLELYGDYLHAHFHELASTDTWLLYRRNPVSTVSYSRCDSCWLSRASRWPLKADQATTSHTITGSRPEGSLDRSTAIRLPANSLTFKWRDGSSTVGSSLRIAKPNFFGDVDNSNVGFCPRLVFTGPMAQLRKLRYPPAMSPQKFCPRQARATQLHGAIRLRSPTLPT